MNFDSGLDFIQKSKVIHEKSSKSYWQGAFDPSHPDTKRHYCMLSSSNHLLDHIKPSSILTVGDNLARDAGYFKKRYPDARCTATDLNTSGIQQAVLDGWVDEVKDADIEQLPFKDNSYDCVIAKEAFHHWPRPMLGVYEMLRCAKKAVLLIEPYDCYLGAVKPLIDKEDFVDQYEEIGNYKYQISLREIQKVAWSLYLPAIAAIGFNDPYEPNKDYDEWIRDKRILDELGLTGERQFNLMAIAIYKLDDGIEQVVLPPGGKMYKRPANPFLEP